MAKATIELTDNKHDVYYCNNCDLTFKQPGPMTGYKFLTGSEGVNGRYPRFDDDNDFFLEGETKVIVGKPSYACHNEDYPCFLDEGHWTEPTCEMFECSGCGEQFTFDNDYCSDHSYSSQADAKSAAKRHLQDHHGVSTDAETQPLKSGEVQVGDLVKVNITGVDGCGWYEGDHIKVTEVNEGSPWVRGICVTSQGEHGTEGAAWNIRVTNVTMVSPYVPDDLADKFKPKQAEKKVTYIDL